MSAKQAEQTTSQANVTLATALLEAQRNMPAVEPDAENPHFKSKFVSLGHLLAKARPVVNEHGISIAQFPSADGSGNPTLVTILMHESGERLEFASPLLLPRNDPQGQGSAITYMRRYALAAALGISDQSDDDGNAGSQAQAQDERPAVSERAAPSDKQLEFLVSLAAKESANETEQEAIRGYGAEKLTGGKNGSCSQTIELLKGEDGGSVLARLVSAAEAWTAGQSDVPADTEGLQ